MIIPLDMMKLSLKGHDQHKILFIPMLTRSRNPMLQGAGRRRFVPRPLVKTKMVPKNDSSFAVFEPDRKLADFWKEIHGQNDWLGLLDPINRLLRAELIRYGDMAQACYDVYDDDPYSKYCGSYKIEPSMFFEYLGHREYGYDVTSYIYSTYNVNFANFFRKSLHPNSWSSSANWIGYIAVSNDEYSSHLGRRDITISWRGTVTNIERVAELMYFQNPTEYHRIPSRDPTIKVEAGFLNLYANKNSDCQVCKYSAREQVFAEVMRLKELYSHEELSITITGHSLGSALAILSAYDIAEIGLDVMEDGRVIPIAVFSYSGPRVGNARFKERLEGLGVKVLRVFNIHDKVPQIPGFVLNENVPKVLQQFGGLSTWSYFHIGEELALDHKNSPFLKDTSNLAYIHNLEVLLHLLDGYHSKSLRFSLTSGRDIALVNKTADILEDHFLVPPNWWQTKNRGLIRNHQGQWRMPERHNFEIHSSPKM